MRLILNVVAAGLLAMPVFASAPGGGTFGKGTSYLGNATFTYPLFEASVPHVDLETCPIEFDPEAVFCRMTLAEGKAHVFVFSFAGDQPLLAVKSFELTDGFLPF